jgi:hypothetical protein
MDEPNSAWQKPELTVLTRNKPEEAVLSGCKLADSGASPADWNRACYLGEGSFSCNNHCVDSAGS